MHLADQAEIDTPGFHIHAMHPDTHRLSEPVGPSAALADQALASGLVMIIIVDQARDVDQPVDLQCRDLYEQPEVGDAGDDTVEGLAELRFHVTAFEPGLDLAGCFLGTPLVRRRDGAEFFHGRARIVVTTGFAAAQPVANRPVYQQIGIPPDR